MKNEFISLIAVDLKNTPGSVYPGEPAGSKPGCTLSLSDADFVGMVTGKLNAQQVGSSGTYIRICLPLFCLYTT